MRAPGLNICRRSFIANALCAAAVDRGDTSRVVVEGGAVAARLGGHRGGCYRVACENASMLPELPDPRIIEPQPAPGAAASIAAAAIAAARASLARAARHISAADDAVIDAAIDEALGDPAGVALGALFDAAPSVDVYRHLWRRLCACAARPAARSGDLAAMLFALPLVVVTARDDGNTDALALAAQVRDPASVAGHLARHGALGVHASFAFAGALAPADAIEVAALPGLYAAARTALDGGAPLAVRGQPIVVAAQESVHLRFLVGSALVAPHARLLDAIEVGAWALPLARELSHELAVPGASVLVLPRAPAPLPQALAAGKLAQRQTSAMLFVSAAARRLRASVGEPTAIVSAHRLGDGSGELRVSLSSPFAPRAAEGFRCPLHAFERVDDAAAMLRAVLADCRIDDVRVEPGIHADRDRDTGLTLLFKPEPATPPH
jgi:hypothetical protein